MVKKELALKLCQYVCCAKPNGKNCNTPYTEHGDYITRELYSWRSYSQLNGRFLPILEVKFMLFLQMENSFCSKLSQLIIPI